MWLQGGRMDDAPVIASKLLCVLAPAGYWLSFHHHCVCVCARVYKMYVCVCVGVILFPVLYKLSQGKRNRGNASAERGASSCHPSVHQFTARQQNYINQQKLKMKDQSTRRSAVAPLPLIRSLTTCKNTLSQAQHTMLARNSTPKLTWLRQSTSLC